MGWAEGSSELGFQKIVETIQVAKPPKVNSKLLLLVSPKQKPIHPQDLEKRRLEEFYRVDTGPWDFASRVAIETLLSNGQALDQTT